MLLAGARAAIEAAGHSHETVTVPGALEVPGAIVLAEETQRYDAYVALGVVIRGETYHFEIVANESSRGLMDLSVRRGIPVGNGILTVENEEQAWERAKVDNKDGDKGGGAVEAVLTVIRQTRAFAQSLEG